MQEITGRVKDIIETTYDETNGMFKVQSMQKKIRDSFAASVPDPTKFSYILGSGMSFDTATPGLLKLNLGLTPNSETIIESVDTFTIPLRVMASIMVPTKQANQEVYLELVSCDPVTKVVDGKHVAAWKLDNNCASQTVGRYQVASSGLARLESGDSTINSWAALNIFEIEAFADEVWFHSRALDSTSGRSNSYVRHQQLPDPNALYKVRIRVKNLGTAPVAANTLQSQYVLVNDYAELTAEVTAGRGNSVAGQGIYATVSGSVSMYNGSLGNTMVTATTTNLASAATYDSGIKSLTSQFESTRLRALIKHLAGTTGHGHLVIEQSDSSTFAANVVETHRIPIPADGSIKIYEFPLMFRYFKIKFINGSIAQTGMLIAYNIVKLDGNFDFDKTTSFTDSTMALTGGATFTGVTLNLGSNHSVNRFRVMATSDQPGTAYIEQSKDGSTWRTVGIQTVLANTPVIIETNVICQYVRVKYTNGATAQGYFELCSALVRQ